MQEIKRKFSGSFEDLIFIAAFLLIYLLRDKALFLAYSPVYDEDFIDDFKSQKEKVENLTSGTQITGERKVLTKIMSGDRKKIRNMINRIADYLKLAKGVLTLAPEDFGIEKVRKELDAKNDEGIVNELRTLYKNCENNKVVLAPAGYTPAISTEMSELFGKLTTDNIDHTGKLDSRISLTQANIIELNKLWDFMDKVMQTGKNIANETENALMMKDYTFANLQDKVRLLREKKEEPAGS